MTPEAAHIACNQGDPVQYRAARGSGGDERGFIMRCTDQFAMVLYVGDTQAKATRYVDLELARP